MDDVHAFCECLAKAGLAAKVGPAYDEPRHLPFGRPDMSQALEFRHASLSSAHSLAEATLVTARPSGSNRASARPGPASGLGGCGRRVWARAVAG